MQTSNRVLDDIARLANGMMGVAATSQGEAVSKRVPIRPAATVKPRRLVSMSSIPL